MVFVLLVGQALGRPVFTVQMAGNAGFIRAFVFQRPAVQSAGSDLRLMEGLAVKEDPCIFIEYYGVNSVGISSLYLDFSPLSGFSSVLSPHQGPPAVAVSEIRKV